jgi:alpha-ribazole phosphatase
MQLYLVRHPQPVVAPGMCYGRSDLAVAVEDMALVRSALSKILPLGAPVFSSPLRRCADLAGALGGSAVTYDQRLLELDFGRWEMQPWDRIARAEIDAWAGDLVHYRPGGGESVLRMAERVTAFHTDLARLNHERVIVICHAGTIRLLAACQRGLTPEQMARAAAAQAHNLAYGEVILLT